MNFRKNSNGITLVALVVTIIILLIFIMPIGLYAYLEAKAESAKVCAVVGNEEVKNPKAKIVKFSSPMCYECQELEKVFNEVYPGVANKISLRKIDVTNNDKSVKQMIKDYDVKLVPTCIFKDNIFFIWHNFF